MKCELKALVKERLYKLYGILLLDELKLKFNKIYEKDRDIYKIENNINDNCEILKVRGEKAVKNEDFDSDATEDEYLRLRDAYEIVKDFPVGYSMSKPLDIFKEHKALLISGCRGKNLKGYYLRILPVLPIYYFGLNKRIERCGIWLAHFHKRSKKVGKYEKYIKNREKHLRRMVDGIKNSGFVIESMKYKQIFYKIKETRKESCIGLIHGNYTYRNIMVSDNEINLIDFEDSRYECIYYDVGQFVSEIISMAIYLNFLPEFIVRYFIKKIKEIFIRSYESINELDYDEVASYCAYHLIHHIYEYSSRSNLKWHKKLIVNYRKKYFKKRVDEILLSLYPTSIE